MDGRMDGRTDRPSYRDARTHLKMVITHVLDISSEEKNLSICWCPPWLDPDLGSQDKIPFNEPPRGLSMQNLSTVVWSLGGMLSILAPAHLLLRALLYKVYQSVGILLWEQTWNKRIHFSLVDRPDQPIIDAFGNIRGDKVEIDQNGKPLEEEEPHPVLCYSHRPYQPAPLHLLLRTITRGRLKTLFVV